MAASGVDCVLPATSYIPALRTTEFNSSARMSDYDNFEEFMEEMGQGHRPDSPASDALQHDSQSATDTKKRKSTKEPEVREPEVRSMLDHPHRPLADTTQVKKKPKVMENKAIWITNLPPDTTLMELSEEFSRFGIIDKGADGEPRIKMYMDDDTGKFTGNAMIVYFKKEAIVNAIKMMDDYVLRPGDYSTGNIRVEPANLEHKKEKDGEKIASKLTRKDRKASERNRQELNRKLNEWSDNEEEVAEAFAPKKNKWAKIAIIKHTFTLEELEEDEEAILDIKDDMRKEAEKCGEVTNCTLYDREPEGIVTVRFREFEPAEKFMKDNQGRSYAHRRLQISLAEDKPKFKKSRNVDEADSEEE
ncbi:splicing factor u2af-associated 2 [Pyrenophora seminiperda CCB06]|uniref:Splicing factor u2af-associated 2 n=1 Tax=Pyrenophora seminiperda CCB06 TaxID=1302712 RepID=A0A3M7M343_9PLEO|nr:splicing factor u2af-associated 2 [Pyrenophora seminiperda CCB06]